MLKKFFKKLIELAEIIFKEILGTKNNLWLKLKLSLFISSISIYSLAVIFQEETNQEAANISKNISGILLVIFFVLVQNNNTIKECTYEFVRLLLFIYILLFSLDFYISSDLNAHPQHLIILSFAACFGLFFCTFYLIAKFFDIYNFIKNLFKQIKEKLFNSPNSNTSKVTALIENITTLFAAIGSLALGIKTIIEPLVNLFK